LLPVRRLADRAIEPCCHWADAVRPVVVRIGASRIGPLDPAKSPGGNCHGHRASSLQTAKIAVLACLRPSDAATRVRKSAQNRAIGRKNGR
jgi:hypothetical protein